MYNWGIDQGLATTNPVAGMKPLATRAPGRGISRKRRSASCGTSWTAGPMRRAILLTACRPGEALGLRWEEISDDGTVWTAVAEHGRIFAAAA